MEYRNGALYETWKDKVKEYASITCIVLPGAIALFCWGAVFGMARYDNPNKNNETIQIERPIQQESKLQELIVEKE